MQSENLTVYLTQRLEGRDQHIELLSQLFEESQVATVETADPALDLITFAQDCTDFWVINAVDSGKVAAGDSLPDDSWPEEPTNSLGLLPASEFGHSVATHPHSPVNSGARGSGSLHTRGARTTPNSRNMYQNDTGSRNRPRYSNEEIYQLTRDKTIAGFIYLLPSSAYPDALHFQEYNIGIVLRPQWRGRGVGKEALCLALDLIFSQIEVHRVQAQLIDCYRNDKALTLFTRMGFSHEGTRRQGFYCPLTAEWKDVTTLALLAMDWLMQKREGRGNSRTAPKSLWDALFARHQREREELLRWEDKRPHRSTSLETVREGATTPVPGNLGETDASDAEAVSASESERAERPKRKLFEIGDGNAGGDAYDASGSEYESDFESAIEGSPPKRFRTRRGETRLAAEGVTAVETNWPNADLSASSNSMHTLVATANQETDGIETADGRQDFLHQRVEDSDYRSLSPSINASPSLNSSPGLSPGFNLSPSPEPREGSVISVPPSEPESEAEPWYTTSESGSESSPSGWELVESDDELGR